MKLKIFLLLVSDLIIFPLGLSESLKKPYFQEVGSHRIHGTGIFTYIYHKNQPNVGKYTIHGWYGGVCKCVFCQLGSHILLRSTGQIHQKDRIYVYKSPSSTIGMMQLFILRDQNVCKSMVLLCDLISKAHCLGWSCNDSFRIFQGIIGCTPTNVPLLEIPI